MTTRAAPVFATLTQPVAHVALCSLTVTRATVVYTDVRCVCGRRVMGVPGVARIEVRKIATDADRSGRGRCVTCKRCSALLEVIEHG